MDIITTKYFQKFLNEMQISGGETSKNFEKFINYVMLSPKNISDFNLPSVTTGDGGDCAIDGMAIAINNKFVANPAELKDVLDLGMDLSVELHFIQSKTSETFDGKEILQFGNGVCDVLKDSETVLTKKRNRKIEEKCKMIQMLLDHYEYFSHPPKCYLYFVTTGMWVDDPNLLCDREKVINDLRLLNLFDPDIQFYTFGSKEIRAQYELTKVQNSATFELKEKIEIPYMDGIKEAYLAVMPIKDYLQIILDSGGQIKKGIFELNVRDFGGIETNRVNQDIEDTIISENRFHFGLLNNGITIVGKSLSKGKGKYTIKNFYIVNGCQTSSILYKNLETIDNSMWVSIKIVITDKEEIIKKIVKATNNQTEVEEIQLLSMDDYQQLLESYYENFDKYYNLYYERRSDQYNSDSNIDKLRIISPEIQIKSFASVFLEAPHRASRFYGTLREDIDKKRIFVNGHKPIMYYTSGLLHHMLEIQFNNDAIDSTYSKFKYHILMIMAKLVWKDDIKPQFNSQKMEDYCEKLIKEVVDVTKFKSLLDQAINIVSKVVRRMDDIRRAISFITTIDIHLAPFYNIKVDGDLRYNFNDRLNELIKKLNLYGLNQTAESLKTYFTLVDVESRESRKKYAKEIYKQVNDVCEILRMKIERSKRYTEQLENVNSQVN
jgi:hypothetical protein